jgi:four helix bundle protein
MPAMSPRLQFDHERLEVYQLALKFVSWLADLLAELRKSKAPNIGEVISQIDRSSISTVLTTAEGNGRRAAKQRAKFFDDARGSATESAACLDLFVAKQATTSERISDGKVLLYGIISMHTKLVAKFDD